MKKLRDGGTRKKRAKGDWKSLIFICAWMAFERILSQVTKQWNV